MTKKTRAPANAYFPEGLPYLGESEEMGKIKKSRKKLGSHRALYSIESASAAGEQNETSSAVSVGSEDYAESLESLDQSTIKSSSIVSRNAERSSDNDDQYTGWKRSLTSSRVSSEEGDSVVEMDDETLTKDDEYSSNGDDGTYDRVDSVLDTEDGDDDDDDDGTQEDTRTNGSDDETDTCLMSIDEHLARRHAKWFAMRFGRELKLCSTEAAEFESEKTERNKKSQIDDDRDGDADDDVCADGEESSLDETNDDASDMDTNTFKSENDTRTLKRETGTKTGTSRSSTTMKSETSTKSETATRSETATKSETTCRSLTTSEGERDMKSLVNSDGSSRHKSVVKTPPPQPKPQVREFSHGQDAQNSDKDKMRRKKKKKSPVVAVAATTDKSYRAHPSEDRKLYNVSQLSIVDIASSNRDISVVEPLKRRDAREAFKVRDVPHEIPAHAFLRDDISSIAPPVRSLYNAGPTSNGSIIHHGMNGRTKVLTRSRSQDVEHGTGSDPSCVVNQSFEKEQVGICCLQRRGNDLELFFIGLISISLLVLVILLIVIVSRN